MPKGCRLLVNGLSRLLLAEEALLDPPNILGLRDVGENLMIEFRSIPSADSGEMDRARLWARERAECLGLENIDGAGLRSN